MALPVYNPEVRKLKYFRFRNECGLRRAGDFLYARSKLGPALMEKAQTGVPVNCWPVQPMDTICGTRLIEVWKTTNAQD